MEHPYENLFGKLKRAGIKDTDFSLQAHRRLGGYSVVIDQGTSAPITITSSIAKTLAQILREPQTLSIDIPCIARIDEEAKPILAKAITESKQLIGIEIGTRLPGDFDKAPLIGPWVEKIMLGTQNPNLIWLNQNSSSLKYRARENEKAALELIESMRSLGTRKSQGMDKATCENIVERLPAILSLLQHMQNYRVLGHERVEPEDVAQILKKTYAIARGYGLKFPVNAQYETMIEKAGKTFPSYSITLSPRSAENPGDIRGIRNQSLDDCSLVLKFDNNESFRDYLKRRDDNSVNAVKSANR